MNARVCDSAHMRTEAAVVMVASTLVMPMGGHHGQGHQVPDRTATGRDPRRQPPARGIGDHLHSSGRPRRASRRGGSAEAGCPVKSPAPRGLTRRKTRPSRITGSARLGAPPGGLGSATLSQEHSKERPPLDHRGNAPRPAYGPSDRQTAAHCRERITAGDHARACQAPQNWPRFCCSKVRLTGNTRSKTAAHAVRAGIEVVPLALALLMPATAGVHALFIQGVLE
jgi:hypothetical protein